MRVVEIGCGVEPGPYFEGAEVHYLAEIDKTMLATAARRGAYTPLATSNGMRLELPDASIDVVLARNVFGDLDLGMDAETRGMKLGVSLSLVATRGFEAFEKFAAYMNAATYRRKLAIVEEASRKLIAGGKLIAVEQFTPDTADDFFIELMEDPQACHDLTFAPARIAQCMPPSYAASHDRYPGDHAWVGTKAAG